MDDLEGLARAVQSARKYRSISPDFIGRVCAQALVQEGHFKAALKAAKNKLHQVAGAFVQQPAPYGRWLVRLTASRAAGAQAFRADCCSLMRRHASTRERLPLLERFYDTVLDGVQAPTRVLDLACGFHPLAIPWMPLGRQAEYVGVDLYQDMADFLSAFIALLGLRGAVLAQDASLPERLGRADVAFLLKAIPSLEQVDPLAGERVLNALQARHLVVSFPVRSLGGRSKGMAVHFERRLCAMLEGKPWSVRRFPFPQELVFRISK